MTAVARIFSPTERRLLDRDAAILSLVMDQVRPADLSPRYETALVQAGTARVRHALDQLDAAVVAAVALERQDRRCDHHTQTCRWCSPWRVSRHGVCRGLRQLARELSRLYRVYDRAFRRLERGR